jgi:hypothetical protein
MAVTGRSQSIYAVAVSTVPLPPGGIQTLWNSRLAKVHPIAVPNQSEKDNTGTFELLPGTRAVWYLRDPASPRVRNIEAAKISGEFAVLANTSGETGKESIVEDLVRIVMNSYAPATSAGFCVGNGALTSAPSSEEESLISLTHKKIKDFQIAFSTRVVSRPDTRTYSDVDEERELAESNGGSLSVIREQKRTVAGLEGKEISISVNSPGEPPSVRFTWHFAGVPQNSFKPMINIVGSAPLPEQAQLQNVWDSLLQSIQSIPPASPR